MNPTKLHGNLIQPDTIAYSDLAGIPNNLATTNANIFTGNQTISGSAQGHVIPLTIASATASLDMSTGNFFTITLPASTTTHINVINVQAGSSANLLISTNTASTCSFSPNVKQPSGSLYTPSTSGSQDIISLIAWNTTTAYAANIKGLV